MKKITSILIVFTLIMSFNIMGVNAATKPGKVKITQKAATNTSITLKWKKAKKAKKYEVWQHKIKKYKKVKTTKAKKVTIKKLKSNKVYKFKVRAVKGKSKGKFTKVTLKTKKPVTHKGITKPTKKLNEGDTYTMDGLNKPVKVKITSYNKYSDGEINIEGKTESGGIYEYVKDDTGDLVELREKGYTNHMTISDDSAYITGLCWKINTKDNDTKTYWTLDGTDPKIGQSDLTGYSRWCIMGVKYNQRNEAYSGRLADYDLKNNPYEKDTTQVKTKLRGTASKGTVRVWYEPHVVSKENSKLVTYYKDKLIYEFHHKRDVSVY